VLIGELQAILAPYGYFTKAIRTFDMVQRTAYGYMYGYRNAIDQLPPGAVQAMMDRRLTINASRNMRTLGEWTEAIAAVPSPATGPAATYLKWVDEVIAKKPKRFTGKRANQIRREPDEVLLECYRFIEKMGNRLPPIRGTREKFARKLMGIIMTHFELAPDKFTPAEIPASFGRAQVPA
jgi:hypothetical protein